jgi:hypothetical protein
MRLAEPTKRTLESARQIKVHVLLSRIPAVCGSLCLFSSLSLSLSRACVPLPLRHDLVLDRLNGWRSMDHSWELWPGREIWACCRVGYARGND